MNMIENISRELCKKSGNDPDKIMTDYECDTWPLWVNYQELAKAALECLKEPTEEMLQIGDLYGGGGAIIAYGEMINAALEDK